MKAVLLAVNSKYVHSSLSVWALAAGVSRYAKRRHSVEIIEATIHQGDREIAERVAAHAPDAVGVSTYIWNAAKLPGLLKALRELMPGAVIALGGPEAPHNAEYWLENGADFVLRGEGEVSFPALLDALEAGETAERIIPEPAPAADWAEPPGYIDALNGRLAYLETSRGCPFKCAFCLSAGSGVRFLPLDAAKERLERLSRSGASTVKLVDRTFNCDAKRAFELFEYIIGLDTECCFHFEVAADLFDGGTLSLLAAAPAGRIQLEAGLQSFYAPALAAVCRKTDLTRAEENIRTLLRKGNIHIHADLIAGLPHETLPRFADSFNRAYALGAHCLQLGFLKLLRGSVLREQAEQLGIRYAAEPPYEITESPWLSADDIKILKHAENALRHTYNKGRFLYALKYTLSASGTRPFELYRKLGEYAPNSGTDLGAYAASVFDFCAEQPGVDRNELLDCVTRDWLGMVKGKNMPPFLRNPDGRRRQAAAEKHLGHALRRDETAVLRSGKAVYVDSADRDPVTGLYKVYDT